VVFHLGGRFLVLGGAESGRGFAELFGLLGAALAVGQVGFEQGSLTGAECVEAVGAAQVV
jgi:hypothetical protein